MEPPKSDDVGLVLVGYLITHADGFEARLGPDKTRAELYAIRSHATIEAMYVRRSNAVSREGPKYSP
jgi:hypothetical protein